jgi:imidazolonepropionase-like amidohydrolase
MESQKGVDMKKTIFAPSALVGAGLQKKSNQVLVVEERKIVSITDGDRRGADLVLPEGTVLLPGMIDCHTHLALDARIPGHLGMMEDPEANQTLRALKSAQDDLASGITGLRCLGDRYYLDVLLRDQGVFDVPWMQVAGIGMKGLHGHGYVGKGFSGKEEFRRQCRENIYHHVDWLKIFIIPRHSSGNGRMVELLSGEGRGPHGC